MLIYERARLIVAFIPLTIYSLHMQKVAVYDPSAIESLAICSEIAKTMSDLHDGADFYARILGNVLTLSQKYLGKSPLGQSVLVKGDAQSGRAPEQTEAESILPDPHLHSLVLRYQGLALALGRMPKIEAIMQTIEKPVSIPKTF
jgi:hypothetical protein